MVEVMTEGDRESMHCQEMVKESPILILFYYILGEKIAHGPIKSEF